MDTVIGLVILAMVLGFMVYRLNKNKGKNSNGGSGNYSQPPTDEK
jgi:hypothetical protein